MSSLSCRRCKCHRFQLCPKQSLFCHNKIQLANYYFEAVGGLAMCVGCQKTALERLEVYLVYVSLLKRKKVYHCYLRQQKSLVLFGLVWKLLKTTISIDDLLSLQYPVASEKVQIFEIFPCYQFQLCPHCLRQSHTRLQQQSP